MKNGSWHNANGLYHSVDVKAFQFLTRPPSFFSRLYRIFFPRTYPEGSIKAIALLPYPCRICRHDVVEDDGKNKWLVTEMGKAYDDTVLFLTLLTPVSIFPKDVKHYKTLYNVNEEI